jgi:hypothetical protein
MDGAGQFERDEIFQKLQVGIAYIFDVLSGKG